MERFKTPDPFVLQGALFPGNPLPEFGYDGMRCDAATGFNMTMFRPYDSSTGSAVQADPLGLAPDSNPYRWCGNSPTNFIDPTGLEDSGAMMNPVWRGGTGGGSSSGGPHGGGPGGGAHGGGAHSGFGGPSGNGDGFSSPCCTPHFGIRYGNVDLPEDYDGGIFSEQDHWGGAVVVGPCYGQNARQPSPTTAVGTFARGAWEASKAGGVGVGATFARFGQGIFGLFGNLGLNNIPAYKDFYDSRAETLSNWADNNIGRGHSHGRDPIDILTNPRDTWDFCGDLFGALAPFAGDMSEGEAPGETTPVTPNPPFRFTPFDPNTGQPVPAPWGRGGGLGPLPPPGPGLGVRPPLNPPQQPGWPFPPSNGPPGYPYPPSSN